MNRINDLLLSPRDRLNTKTNMPSRHLWFSNSQYKEQYFDTISQYKGLKKFVGLIIINNKTDLYKP